MRFAIRPSAAQPFRDVIEVARHAEQTGWDGVYVADHFMSSGAVATPVDSPTLECGTLVAAIAGDRCRFWSAAAANAAPYASPPGTPTSGTRGARRS